MRHLISFLSIIAIHGSVFGAASPEPAHRWLILGASDRNQPSFDEIFQNTGVQWEGLDNDCPPGAARGEKVGKIICSDFNDERDLERLSDNTYSVIYFDWSTAKFSNWNRAHLQILSKKLKDPGLLLIPRESMLPHSVDLSPTLRAGYIIDTLKTMFPSFKTSVENDDVFLNGHTNFEISSQRYPGPKWYEQELFVNRLVISHNLSLLKTVFADAELAQTPSPPFVEGEDDGIITTKRAYPSTLPDMRTIVYPPLHSGRRIKTFYVALKNNMDQTKGISEIYLKLIIDMMPIIDTRGREK